MGSPQLIDRWILAKCEEMLKYVRAELDQYRLYTILKFLIENIEHLSNWYIRLNRSRLKNKNEGDNKRCLDILFKCFLNQILVISPFCPFIVEYFY